MLHVQAHLALTCGPEQNSTPVEEVGTGWHGVGRDTAKCAQRVINELELGASGMPAVRLGPTVCNPGRWVRSVHHVSLCKSWQLGLMYGCRFMMTEDSAAVSQHTRQRNEARRPRFRHCRIYFLFFFFSFSSQ